MGKTNASPIGRSLTERVGLVLLLAASLAVAISVAQPVLAHRNTDSPLSLQDPTLPPRPSSTPAATIPERATLTPTATSTPSWTVTPTPTRTRQPQPSATALPPGSPTEAPPDAPEPTAAPPLTPETGGRPAMGTWLIIAGGLFLAGLILLAANRRSEPTR
jgi:hypothetical protein